MKLTDDSVTSVLSRYFLYAVCIVALSYLIIWDASIVRTNNSFSENSLTEMCQELFLSGIVVLFFRFAAVHARHRSFNLIMALLFSCALIREFDSFFDNRIFDGAWQMAVLFVCTAATAVWLRDRSGLNRSVTAMLHNRSSGIMLCGILTIMVFSRLFGQQTLWTVIMGDGFMRPVKNAVEEGVELYGYFLCFIATVEHWCESYRPRETEWLMGKHDELITSPSVFQDIAPVSSVPDHMWN